MHGIDPAQVEDPVAENWNCKRQNTSDQEVDRNVHAQLILCERKAPAELNDEGQNDGPQHNVAGRTYPSLLPRENSGRVQTARDQENINECPGQTPSPDAKMEWHRFGGSGISATPAMEAGGNARLEANSSGRHEQKNAGAKVQSGRFTLKTLRSVKVTAILSGRMSPRLPGAYAREAIDDDSCRDGRSGTASVTARSTRGPRRMRRS